MTGTAPPGGRRRKQVRTALRTFRTGRPPAGCRDRTSELRSFVDEPYADPTGAARQLEGLLESFEDREDRRAVFLDIYARMTAAVAARIERGEFADPDWVADYLVAFANLYREAVLAYETGCLESVADPWQLAFQAADRGDTLRLQDAALGVNAHVNYDLAYALDRVGVEGDREQKYADHSVVTEVIRRLVDDAQDSLVARDAVAVETLDESLGRFDEWLTVFTIDECRDSAWRTALALNSEFGIRRRFARWVNDVTSTGAAYLILGSTASTVDSGTPTDRTPDRPPTSDS